MYEIEHATERMSFDVCKVFLSRPLLPPWKFSLDHWSRIEARTLYNAELIYDSETKTPTRVRCSSSECLRLSRWPFLIDVFSHERLLARRFILNQIIKGYNIRRMHISTVSYRFVLAGQQWRFFRTLATPSSPFL